MRDEGGRNGASIVGINKGTAGVLLLLNKKKRGERWKNSKADHVKADEEENRGQKERGKWRKKEQRGKREKKKRKRYVYHLEQWPKIGGGKKLQDDGFTTETLGNRRYFVIHCSRVKTILREYGKKWMLSIIFSPIPFFIDGYFCSILLLFILHVKYSRQVCITITRELFSTIFSHKSNRFSEREREIENSSRSKREIG